MCDVKNKGYTAQYIRNRELTHQNVLKFILELSLGAYFWCLFVTYNKHLKKKPCVSKFYESCNLRTCDLQHKHLITFYWRHLLCDFHLCNGSTKEGLVMSSHGPKGEHEIFERWDHGERVGWQTKPNTQLVSVCSERGGAERQLWLILKINGLHTFNFLPRFTVICHVLFPYVNYISPLTIRWRAALSSVAVSMSDVMGQKRLTNWFRLSMNISYCWYRGYCNLSDIDIDCIPNIFSFNFQWHIEHHGHLQQTPLHLLKWRWSKTPPPKILGFRILNIININININLMNVLSRWKHVNNVWCKTSSYFWAQNPVKATVYWNFRRK